MNEPRGCPTPGACSSVQRERELRNLVEDLQEQFAALLLAHPLPGTIDAEVHRRRMEQMPTNQLLIYGKITRSHADKIRAGLDRLRQGDVSMDLEKLTPAPWKVAFHGMVDPSKAWRIVDSTGDTVGWCISGSDASIIALARNAFDVMTRRGWWAEPIGQNWYVSTGRFGASAGEVEAFLSNRPFPDPFTALVEADRWFVQNVVEGKP
jgi:hypothetical protein